MTSETGWADVIKRSPDKVKLIVSKQSYHYPVKGIVLISGVHQKHIWIGKQKIANKLFPKKTTQSQEAIDVRNVKTALRQLVEPQMKTVRSKLRTVAFSEKDPRCPLSGDSLLECKTHVDHTIPFTSLVEDFFRERRLDISRVEYSKRGTHVNLKDHDLAEEFVKYHFEKADLKLVCAKANLQKGSKFI